MSQETHVKLLSVKQASESAGVSESLVYEWCSQRLLPHYRLGAPGRRGKVMIDENDLQAFLLSCRQEARPQDEAPPLKHIQLHERHG
jgi:excisionase family DNA binding protein